MKIHMHTCASIVLGIAYMYMWVIFLPVVQFGCEQCAIESNTKTSTTHAHTHTISRNTYLDAANNDFWCIILFHVFVTCASLSLLTTLFSDYLFVFYFVFCCPVFLLLHQLPIYVHCVCVCAHTTRSHPYNTCQYTLSFRRRSFFTFICLVCADGARRVCCCCFWFWL